MQSVCGTLGTLLGQYTILDGHTCRPALFRVQKLRVWGWDSDEEGGLYLHPSPSVQWAWGKFCDPPELYKAGGGEMEGG